MCRTAAVERVTQQEASRDPHFCALSAGEVPENTEKLDNLVSVFIT